MDREAIRIDGHLLADEEKIPIKVAELQSPFLTLATLLAHKDKIKPTFKNYTADLAYDLSVYKSIFDRVDSDYREEPENVRELIQKGVIDTHGKRFMRFLDEELEELERIVVDFCKEEHECHGFYFRRQLWNIILCSPFLTRTNLKPRGYIGDSEMMRMIYRNEYEGNSTFSKLMHKHPLEHPAAQAVRARRHIIAKMISDVKKAYLTESSGKLKVLSVACGPAFEIQDIIRSPEDCRQYHFTLLDQDRHALLEAAEWISQIEKRLNNKTTVDYLNDSVRTMLASAELRTQWGQFHFIYSMGLFDYLTPPVARAVLRRLYELLRPGGEMVIGNFHVSNPSKHYMEYWADWVLYYRTEEEFRNLLNDASSSEIEVFFEDTRSQMFLHIRRLE